MKEIIKYLLETSACLAALYLVYWVFLRRDTFFMVNRLYLLSAVILSLALPLFPVRFEPGSPLATVIVFLDPVLVSPSLTGSAALFNLEWMEIAGIVYLTGVAIFTIRFLVQLFQLFLLAGRIGITRSHGLNVVFVDRGYSPFSFFNLLFIRKEWAADPRLSAIIEHERIHIRQMHTADLVMTELLTIVQWFNPFAWLLQRSVKTVHEYLADEGVLRKGIPGEDYRRLIFSQILGVQVNNLTNNFNVSLIKNRMIMMTRSRSAKMAGLKAIFALPVLFAVVLFFSAGSVTPLLAQDNNEKAQKEAQLKAKQEKESSEPVYGSDSKLVPDHQPEFPGGFEALSKFILENLKYPEAAQKAKTQGNVVINFIVNTDGSIVDAKVMRGIGNGCDEEALRVVKLMPKWKPGYMNDGKLVRVGFVLPLNFKLDDKKK
jgi:TonB family protein